MWVMRGMIDWMGEVKMQDIVLGTIDNDSGIASSQVRKSDTQKRMPSLNVSAYL